MSNTTTVGLITPEPGHPLLAATTELLGREHRVVTVHPETADAAVLGRLADVYLLKSRTPRALALARGLEARGAVVINSAEATALCQDRTAMAERARDAGLPFSATRTFGSLAELAADAGSTGPLVVKSRHSRRHDLVARVDSPGRLAELAGAWADEPVVAQEFAENNGYDHKLWVIDGTVFAALRRSSSPPGAAVPRCRSHSVNSRPAGASGWSRSATSSASTSTGSTS